MNALIVTCDDCGLSEGVNIATLDLYQRGIAGGASVMTNFPAAAHALDLFRACPGLSVGIHLNLTDGFPLTPIPAGTGLIRPDGRFRPIAHLAWQALFLSARTLSVIEEELTAQFDVLVRAGFAPRHVTTHLQFHVLPSLRRIVLRLAHAYHVPWVRPHRVRATVVPWNPLLARKLGTARSRYARRHGARLYGRPPELAGPRSASIDWDAGRFEWHRRARRPSRYR